MAMLASRTISESVYGWSWFALNIGEMIRLKKAFLVCCVPVIRMPDTVQGSVLFVSI